ncbi:Leucine-rich repeat-containing protein 63 [Terramyces sp. JEL0728]|nr:Leucine-rich repeat-containing protein 63 [Terramyces sp. JEL0728]
MLCCNSLAEIPDAIGYMRNLTNLSLANNKIVALPDTLGYLEKLTELTVSNNELVYIPCSIGLLKNLTTLSLQRNNLTELPVEIGKLKKLEMIDVSNNPLELLPAEISRIFSLKLLRTNECPFIQDIPLPSVPRVLSLKELAARFIVRNQIPITYTINDQLQKYLTSSHECSFCKGPYFGQYESRIRMVTRNNKSIPIESRLCIDHYDNELKRIEKLFSIVPLTAPARSSAPSTPNRSRSSSNASVKEKTLHSSPSLPNLPQKERKPKLIRRLSSAVLKTSLSMTFLRDKNLH